MVSGMSWRSFPQIAGNALSDVDVIFFPECTPHLLGDGCGDGCRPDSNEIAKPWKIDRAAQLKLNGQAVVRKGP